MSIFQWIDSYDTGILEIDMQHKKLVAMINTLFDELKQGKANTIVHKLLKDLEDYTSYHFNAEEMIFKHFGYPELNRHKQEHDELRKYVSQFMAKLEMKDVLISVELLEFLKQWLQKHILESDKKFGFFMENKQKRK